MSVKPAREWLALAILLVLAASVRLYALGEQSLWLDEAISLRLSELPWNKLGVAIRHDTHPPLYPLLLHSWIALCGRSEFALRLPSTFFGILALGLLWDIARKVGMSTWARIAGVAATCLSPLLIAHAQEARPHVLLMVLGILSLWLFLRTCDRFTWPGALALIGVNTAILYTQYLGVCLIVSEVLILIIARVRRWKVDGHPLFWVAIFVVSSVLFLPWLPIFTDQLAASHDQMAWMKQRGWKGILGDLRQYTGPAGNRGIFGWIGLTLILVLALIGSFRGAASRLGQATLVIWTSVGIGIPLLLSFGMGRPIPIARATLAVALVIFLLAAVGLDRLARARFIVSGLLLVLLIWGTWEYHHVPHKRPWREAAELIRRKSQGSEPAIFCAPFGVVPYGYYEPDASRPLERLRPGLPDIQLVQDMRRGTHGRHRFWLLLSYLDSDVSLREAARTLGYRIRDEYLLWKLTLIHYERIE